VPAITTGFVGDASGKREIEPSLWVAPIRLPCASTARPLVPVPSAKTDALLPVSLRMRDFGGLASPLMFEK
jgi:hypothetical protein